METLGKKKLFLLGVLVVGSCYFSLCKVLLEKMEFLDMWFLLHTKKLWGLI